MNPARLLENFDRISEAPGAVGRLRRFIFELAVHGKLVEQNPNDEPAPELLKRIHAEKEELAKTGKVRKQDIAPLIEDEKLPFKIKTGWCWARLAAISRKIHYGFTASANPLITDVRLLRITDIQDNAVDWSAVPGCEISDNDVEQYKIERGDILIARTGGTIGKTFLVRETPVKAVFASYLIRVQGSLELYDQYLKLFMESPVYWQQLQDGARGGGQPNVNGQTLGQMVVPIPPLAEQHRVVAKVDELMALCDQLEAAKNEREAQRDRLVAASLHRIGAAQGEGQTATALRQAARFHLDYLPRLTTRIEHIKQLRQTILNLAVRGRLVSQDPNDEPASELLKRVTLITGRQANIGIEQEEQRMFEPPSGWAWSRVGLITTKTGSGSTPRGGQAAYQPTGVPFLRSQNVYNDGLHLNDVAYINQNTHRKMSGTALQPGDLLLNITGGSIGRCCLIPEDPIEANISQHVAIIRLADAGMRRFVHRVILSPFFQSFVVDEQTGAGRGGLPKNRMDQIPVPVPPLAEQHRIVAKVDELMALCDQLETQLAASEADSRRLLEAVLRDALAA